MSKNLISYPEMTDVDDVCDYESPGLITNIKNPRLSTRHKGCYNGDVEDIGVEPMTLSLQS